jgi:acyl-CoA reductase-like NAD-dependent aldehyde dehydrogenase
MKDYLVKAIRKLKPNSEFSYSNDDYSTIKWDVLDGEAPTQKEIDDAIKKVKADELAEAQVKATERQAILDRLGITAEEAQLLLS